MNGEPELDFKELEKAARVRVLSASISPSVSFIAMLGAPGVLATLRIFLCNSFLSFSPLFLGLVRKKPGWSFVALLCRPN